MSNLRELLENRPKKFLPDTMTKKFNKKIEWNLLSSIEEAENMLSLKNFKYRENYESLLKQIKTSEYIINGPNFEDRWYRFRFAKELLAWHKNIEILNNNNREFEGQNPSDMLLLYRVQYELRDCLTSFFYPLDCIFAFKY